MLNSPSPGAAMAKAKKRRFSFSLFHKGTLAITLVTLMLISGLLWYGYVIKQKVIAVEKQWQDYSTQATYGSHVLSHIQSTFGYGGFIHNFKNYVLRKDENLVAKIEKGITETRRAISQYPVHGIYQDHDDAFFINNLSQVVDQYAVNFELAKQLVAKGTNSNEIDRRVKVDDTPAIQAIKHLSNHAVDLKNEYAIEMSKHLNKVLSFINWGFLLLPLILLSSFIMLVLLKKITAINNNLKESHQYLSDLFEASPDAVLIVNESGIITEANQQAVKIFDTPVINLTGLRVESLLPQRCRDQYARLHIEYFVGDKAIALRHDLEFYALGKNNNEIPVEISISYTHRNRQKYSLINFRDITARKEAEKVLLQNEAMLRRAQRIANIGSWDWDIASNKLVWSDEIFHIFGVEKNVTTVNYDNFLTIIHPEDKEKVEKAIRSAVVNDQPYEIEHRIIRADGTQRLVCEQGDVFRNEEGKAINMVGVVRDITDKKQNQIKLKLADNVFNSTMESIIITDSDSRILRVNSAFRAMTGYSNKDVQGKKPGDLLNSGKHERDFYKSMWKEINNNGHWHGEIWDRRKDGSLFLARHNINAVKDREGNIIQYLSIFLDITEKKRAEEHIQHMAQYDQLTNLPNRSLFNDRLHHAIDRAQRDQDKIALMFIDLDGFKKVNDTLGHQAGDELLQIIAKRMSRVLRTADTVARLGGDEFTIILEELHHTDDAIIVANKVLQVIGEAATLSGQEVNVGASIGISIYPDNGVDATSLIKNADMAMYQAKKQGKNCYNFYIK